MAVTVHVSDNIGDEYGYRGLNDATLLTPSGLTDTIATVIRDRRSLGENPRSRLEHPRNRLETAEPESDETLRAPVRAFQAVTLLITKVTSSDREDVMFVLGGVRRGLTDQTEYQLPAEE